MNVLTTAKAPVSMYLYRSGMAKRKGRHYDIQNTKQYAVHITDQTQTTATYRIHCCFVHHHHQTMYVQLFTNSWFSVRAETQRTTAPIHY